MTHSGIVGGLSMSHAPGMTGWPEDLKADEHRAVFAAVDEARARVQAAAPTLIVAFLDDHFDNHYRGLMPQLSIPVADEHRGPGEWAKVLGIADRSVPSDAVAAEELLISLVAEDFDVARMGPCRYGNNLMVPLDLLAVDRTIPVVPVFINVFTPPIISTARALALGRAVRRIVARRDERVLFLGTGGLSHWPPIWAAERPTDEFLKRMHRYQTLGPEALKDDPGVLTDIGPYEQEMARQLGEKVVNPDWDQEFLRLLSDGDTEALARWDYESIERGGGHGGHEILNWLAVAGALDDHPCDVLLYSPTVPWICGTGIVWHEPHP